MIFILILSIDANAQIVDKIGFIQFGEASYYKGDRNNIITQSGEKYDMNSLEAGHNHLVFNSLVKVINLENQKEVVVRINDRIYSNQRILDLTHAAAKELGFFNKNKVVYNVKIEVIQLGVKRNVISSSDNSFKVSNNDSLLIKLETLNLNTSIKYFSPINTYLLNGTIVKVCDFGIQLAAFNNIDLALEKGGIIEELGLDIVYIQSGWQNNQKVYRVILGNYSNRKKLNQIIEKMKDLGYKSFFIKKHFN